MRKTKTKQTRPTREEILRDWEPLVLPRCPAAVVRAENRRMQDYIVGWVQGLGAHLEKVDAAASRKRAQWKRLKASPAPTRKKRPRLD